MVCRVTTTDADLVEQLRFVITGFPPGSVMFNINSDNGIIRVNRSLYYKTENRLVILPHTVFMKVGLRPPG